MRSNEAGINSVWFSPLERTDGTLSGIVVAVNREDGFIEGAVNTTITGAAEALCSLTQPSGQDAPSWLTAAAKTMSAGWHLGAPTQAMAALRSERRRWWDSSRRTPEKSSTGTLTVTM